MRVALPCNPLDLLSIHLPLYSTFISSPLRFHFYAKRKMASFGIDFVLSFYAPGRYRLVKDFEKSPIFFSLQADLQKHNQSIRSHPKNDCSHFLQKSTSIGTKNNCSHFLQKSTNIRRKMATPIFWPVSSFVLPCPGL